MGTACSSNYPNPPNSRSHYNECNNKIGDVIELKNFCTTAGPAGESIRRRYCSYIGDNSGEWTYDGEGSSCEYNDCNNYQRYSGCCGKCCGIAGRGVKCKRVSFKGSPLTCCLSDYQCTGVQSNQLTCYADDFRRKTCDPKYRSMATISCKAIIFDYCTGLDNPSVEEWLSRWIGQSIPPDQTLYVDEMPRVFNTICYNALARNLYSSSDSQPQVGACYYTLGLGIPTDEGFKWSKRLFDAMFLKYVSSPINGQLYNDINFNGSIRLNEMIWNICHAYPGLCKDSLKQYCTNVTNDVLLRKPDLIPWCGCFMQDNQYSKYTDTFLINRECTPMCNRPGNVRLTSPDGIKILQCNQSTCVIDDFSINIAYSQIGDSGKGIDFSQICPSCSLINDSTANGAITCNCLLAGTTMKIIDSNVPSLQVSQQCSNGSACYTQDEEGNIRQVPCSSDGTYDYYKDIEQKTQENYNKALQQQRITILVVIVIFILLVFLIYWIVFDSKLLK